MATRTRAAELTPKQRERLQDREVRRALLTYNYLRLIVNAPVVLLIGTMIAWWAFDGDIPTSISGYYATPVRDVFVGAMVAIAFCMIIYKGTLRLEDYSLNLFGIFAIFVALVPSNLADVLAGETADEVRTGLRGSLIAAVCTLVIFGIIDLVKVSHGDEWRALFRIRGQKVWPWLAAVLASLGALAFAVLLTLRFIQDDDYGWVHNFAAIALVACLVIAVSSHGWPDHSIVGKERIEDIAPQSTGIYRLIVLIMVAAGLAFGVIKLVHTGWFDVECGPFGPRHRVDRDPAVPLVLGAPNEAAVVPPSGTAARRHGQVTAIRQGVSAAAPTSRGGRCRRCRGRSRPARCGRRPGPCRPSSCTG